MFPITPQPIEIRAPTHPIPLTFIRTPYIHTHAHTHAHTHTHHPHTHTHQGTTIHCSILRLKTRQHQALTLWCREGVATNCTRSPKPEADMSVNDPATCRYKLGTFGFVKLAITSHTAHVVRHQSMHPLL